MLVHNVDEPIDLSVAPMATEDVKKRLSDLHQIDLKIIELLETASEAVTALVDGKSASNSNDSPDAKTAFKENTQKYFALLETVSVGLRKEIRLLHQESKEKVLPLSLAAKADWIGEQKEQQLWQVVDGLLKAEVDEGDESKMEVDS